MDNENPAGTPGKDQRDQPPPTGPGAAPSARIPYFENEGGLWMTRPNGKEPDAVSHLTNFTVRILADVVRDDGVERFRELELEARLRKRTVRFSIPAERLAGMGWVIEHLGSQALVFPGSMIKDHTRASIQLGSGAVPERRIYAHTGWRQIDGLWVYLHAGGAIGAAGAGAGIEVVLPDGLQQFELPAPPDPPETITAIHRVLQFLTVAPLRITFALLAGVFRAPLGGSDHALAVVGQSGGGKTELAALAQQHFGPAMDARHLPASWSSTGNALEGQAFVLKDSLLVVDDFAPQGSAADIQRFHREAARLFRAQGNAAGRQRMRADATLRPAKPPRGLILSTGEDVPQGQSIRARLFIIEVGPGELQWDVLTNCQADAAAGHYARAMAAYMRWLAQGRYMDLRKTMRRELATLRDRLAQGQQHRRLPDIVANLLLGLICFTDFALAQGALTAQEAHGLLERGEAALLEGAEAQSAHQASSDPTVRFIELLRSAFAAGRAYVSAAVGGLPEQPQCWGWRDRNEGAAGEEPVLMPQGDRIGWLRGEDLYLEPDAAFHTAQAMAGFSGEALPLTRGTLFKRLHEKGLLRTTDEARQRSVVRQTLEGVRRSVLHLAAATLMPREPAQAAQPARPTQPATRADNPGPPPEPAGPIGPVGPSLLDEDEGGEREVHEL